MNMIRSPYQILSATCVGFSKTARTVRGIIAKWLSSSHALNENDVTSSISDSYLQHMSIHDGQAASPVVASVAEKLLEETPSMDPLLAEFQHHITSRHQSLARHHFGQLRAFDLYRWNFSGQEISECLGVSQQTAKQWREDVRVTLGISQGM